LGNTTSAASAARRSSACDRHHPDPGRREIARRRQRHTGDAGLRRRVGDLADLAVERRDRRGIDDHAALAVVQRLGLRDRRRGEPHHVERPDQVDADDLLEQLEVVRLAGAVERARRPADAGARHRDPQRAELRGGCQRGLDLAGVGDVGPGERGAELAGQRLAARLVAIDDDDPGTACDQAPRRRGPQPRGSSGDECNRSAELHAANIHAIAEIAGQLD
jgi:hypothetical protein